MQTEDWVKILSLVFEQYTLKVKLYEQSKVLDGGIHEQLSLNFYQQHVVPSYTLYTKVSEEIVRHMAISLHSK
jgi:hypothetical protein